jgi:hypothetical protein
MRDRPHFGGLAVQPASAFANLQPEFAPACCRVKRGKNQENEA